MEIFKKILDSRSMTLIMYRIDEELPNVPEGPAKEALLKMQDTNKLDEVWALAHEQLGQYDEAAKLRKWIADKPERDKQQVKMQAFLSDNFPEHDKQ